MYQGYKSQISTAQLANQLDMLAETKAKALAAKALGFQPDQSHKVRAEMDYRINQALWMIDNWDWVCETQANLVGPQPACYGAMDYALSSVDTVRRTGLHQALRLFRPERI